MFGKENALPFAVPPSTTAFWKPTISVIGPSDVPTTMPMSFSLLSSMVILPSASALMPLISCIWLKRSSLR